MKDEHEKENCRDCGGICEKDDPVRPCRNCGELNVVEYAPAMSPDGVDNVLQVDGDILVLDGPLLEQMQALVATSSDGRVQIRLKQAVHPDAR